MINLIELTGSGSVNSGFGYRGNIGVEGASTNHKGIDITLSNDNIPAVLDSIVLNKGTDATRGNYVTVQQSDGTTATYMHLAKLVGWNVGDTVAEGQTIGVQGSTGVSSGKHLHYEVQSNGEYIDPETYLTSGTDGNYSTLYATTTATTESEDESIWATIIRILVYVLLAVVAAVLFFFAFDIKIK